MKDNCYIVNKDGARLLVEYEVTNEGVFAECQHDKVTEHERGDNVEDAIGRICRALKLNYDLEFYPEAAKG